MREQKWLYFIRNINSLYCACFWFTGRRRYKPGAKQATYDSMQRSAALGVARDVIGRIKANTLAAMAGAYNVTVSSDDPVAANYASCINANCGSGALAAFDIEQWRRAIRAQENTGALADATVCVDTRVNGEQLDIDVIVSWASRQELASTGDIVQSKDECGGQSNQRRALSLESFAYVR